MLVHGTLWNGFPDVVRKGPTLPALLKLLNYPRVLFALKKTAIFSTIYIYIYISKGKYMAKIPSLVLAIQAASEQKTNDVSFEKV